jgi:RNA polymerase sigma-70 factor (sigma-E family)
MSMPRPPDGFAEFVAQTSPALLRRAWVLTGDAALAEDLLQTALASAWRRWSRVLSYDSPEAYVRRVLYTTYLSWWRRRWRREAPLADPPDRAAAGDHAGEIAEQDAVRRALARLSRQQRAIVALRYVEDLSVAETAAILSCSQNTVKVQASRALAKLRTDPQLRIDHLTEVQRARSELASPAARAEVLP